MSIYSNYRGKELIDDPEYQKKLQDPAFKLQIENTSQTTLNETLPFSSKLSVHPFLLSLAIIVLLAVFP